jgi:hypothetical protein
MTTVALQLPVKGAAALQGSITGPQTGRVYTVNTLGQVLVDSTDAADLQAKNGFIPVLSATSSLPTSGSTTIDFGAFPGSNYASTTITFSDVYDPNAIIDAWILPATTADHSADEHVVDPPLITVTNNGDGTITINGVPSGRDPFVPALIPFGNTANSQMPVPQAQVMPYGKWNVGYAFSP